MKKDKVTTSLATKTNRRVKRSCAGPQIPLVPGFKLTSTIHVAQGTEMSPIIKLDETMTPTHVFVQQMPHRAVRQIRL